jgi:hypothetical protein
MKAVETTQGEDDIVDHGVSGLNTANALRTTETNQGKKLRSFFV